MSRLCAYCHHLVDPWGVQVTYRNRWYHLPCWDQVRRLSTAGDEA